MRKNYKKQILVTPEIKLGEVQQVLTLAPPNGQLKRQGTQGE